MAVVEGNIVGISAEGEEILPEEMWEIIPDTRNEDTEDEVTSVDATNCVFCYKVFMEDELAVFLNDTIFCMECYKRKKLSHKYAPKLRTSATNLFGVFFDAFLSFFCFYSFLCCEMFISFSDRCFILKDATVDKCCSFFSAVSSKMLKENLLGVMKWSAINALALLLFHSLVLPFAQFIMLLKLWVLALGLFTCSLLFGQVEPKP